jgi:hypothetical protein
MAPHGKGRYWSRRDYMYFKQRHTRRKLNQRLRSDLSEESP